jgi:hypothetical protein
MPPQNLPIEKEVEEMEIEGRAEPPKAFTTRRHGESHGMRSWQMLARVVRVKNLILQQTMYKCRYIDNNALFILLTSEVMRQDLKNPESELKNQAPVHHQQQ